MKRSLSVFSLAVLLLSGCTLFHNATHNSVQNSLTLDTVNVVAPRGPQIYRAAATKYWEISHTRIALKFDLPGKIAMAREWIDMHPYNYDQDSIVLDAKSMKIQAIELQTNTGFYVPKYHYANDILTVYTTKTMTANDSIQLYLVYKAMPYAATTGGSSSITDDRGLYFINTDQKIPGKPVEIWTQGESESNAHWMITIDKPNTRFTTQIELTVPDSMTTLSNGELISLTTTSNGLRTDVWRMDMPIQAYVAMFAVGKFSIVPDQWRGKEVNYFVEPEYAPFARNMFRYTPEMMDCFSSATGVPFPWVKYDQVVARDYVSGAMENTTAALFGEFMNRTNRELLDANGEDVVAHELFHEWFGDYVTCKSWSNLTVNESFANYGEQIWRKYKHGKASADELAYNDLQRYLHTSRYHDPQLVRFYYDYNEAMFDGITYNKGGAILRYISELAGEKTFSKAMKLYLTKNALHSAEAHDWRMALEEATGEDWNWFFNEWYFHPGHPVLEISYPVLPDTGSHRHTVAMVVKQVQQDSTYTYDLPLKAAVLAADGSVSVNPFRSNKKTDTFYFPVTGAQQYVIVPDYEHVLPGEINEKKTPQQWLIQYQSSSDFITKKLALNAAAENLSDSAMQLVVDMGLNDANSSLRRAAVTTIKETNSNYYKKRWNTKIAALALHDSSTLVRGDAFGLLGAWRDTAMMSEMIRACNDSSYYVAANALEGIWKLDTAQAYTIARNLIPGGPRASLESTCWLIIGTAGKPSDLNLYKTAAPQMMTNNSKYTLLNSLFAFLKNKELNTPVFDSAVNLYAQNWNLLDNKMMSGRYSGFMVSLAHDYKNNDEQKDRFNYLKTMIRQMISATDDIASRDALQKKADEMLKD